MEIISTICPTGPMKSAPCFAILGVRYQDYFVPFIFSLVIGFVVSAISYFIYSKIKNEEFNYRTYVIISTIVSFVVFIIFSSFLIYMESTAIY